MGVNGNDSSLASPYILEEARVLQRETNLGLPLHNFEVKLVAWYNTVSRTSVRSSTLATRWVGGGSKIQPSHMTPRSDHKTEGWPSDIASL